MGILIVAIFVLIGPTILILSLLFAKSLSTAIIGGIFSTTIMMIESVSVYFFAGVGSATSGDQSGYKMAELLALFFAVCSIVYFVIVSAKFGKK